jgi:hypothetical protein
MAQNKLERLAQKIRRVYHFPNIYIPYTLPPDYVIDLFLNYEEKLECQDVMISRKY